MKKFVLAVLVLAVCFSLCACTDTAANPPTTNPLASESNASTPESDDAPVALQMVKIHSCKINNDNSIDYYRDTITDVMYVCFNGYRKAGLTEMHDPETGLPLTYTRYIEIYNNLEAEE